MTTSTIEPAQESSEHLGEVAGKQAGGPMGQGD